MTMLSAVLMGGCLKKDGLVGTKPMKTESEIAKAMEAGEAIYCVMSTTEGGTIETWTKGKKTKAYGGNIGGGAGTGYMINDDDWTYMWAEGETTGTKFAMIDEETPRSEGVDQFEGEMPDFDVQAELKKYQVNDYEYECNQENIPDSTFVPPAGVTFVDMMEKMGEMMEGLDIAN